MRSNSHRILRTLSAAALVVAAVVGACALVAAPSADAQVEVIDLPGIDVVQITGLIDPPNASLLRNAIDRAEERGSTALVVQLDSGGAIDVDVDDLHSRIEQASVPVVVWIGPAGGGARGAAAYLATAGQYLSMATNARLGPCESWALDESPSPNDTASCAPDERLGAEAAKTAGLADSIDPSLRNLLFSLDGVTVTLDSGESRSLSTKIVDPDSDDPSLNQDLRFDKLDVAGQALHTLGAPWVAYFLFVSGIALIVFELYAASVGAAAIVGAGALIGAFTGFSHLPVAWWALGLVALGLFGLTVDLQAGGVGVWTAIGVLAMVVGSVFLYDGSSRLDLTWWIVLLVVLGTLAFWVGGLPAMLRTRFSTPTVGREGMIGEMGTAEVDINPEGVVKVRDALWKARVNRATPIAVGDAVRVVAVEGLVLEVEPESGGAQDYRERARNRRS